MSSRPGRESGRACVVAVLLIFGFLVVILASACDVEPYVGQEATATVQAVRKVQANQALEAGIDIEDDQDAYYASVAYGSGLRYDPENEDLAARLARSRKMSTKRRYPATYTPVATPVPIEPSNDVPDAELGLRQFGQVSLGALPARRIMPLPTSRFSTEDQPVLFAEAFQRKEITVPYEMRFFDMNSRMLLHMTCASDNGGGIVRWFDSLVWYKQGSEARGSYRVEIYSLGRLTHILPFDVGDGPAATPTATMAPGGVARPAGTPVPAVPQIVSLSPFPDAEDVLGSLPITVSFDLPLDPKTVGSEALQLFSGGLRSNGMDLIDALPGKVTLSADGKSVTFEALGGAVAGNGSYSASLSDKARSLAGVAVKPKQWSFSTKLYDRSKDGQLANGDFSRGMESWNVDIGGAAAGFGRIAAVAAANGAGQAAGIVRRGGGGDQGAVGLFQDLELPVPAGASMSLAARVSGADAEGSGVKYTLWLLREGATVAKTGVLAEGKLDGWRESGVDFSSGDDPVKVGDVVTRLGLYGFGGQYDYKVDDVKLALAAATPTPSPTATATPIPTPTPMPTSAPTATARTRDSVSIPAIGDSVSIPAITMVPLKDFAPGVVYLVTADITYTLESAPNGVIRLTPYEDESNAGVNFLYEIHVRRGSDTIKIAAPFVPKPTSSQVRFQAYFRDGVGKHIGEAYTDNYPLKGR